MAPSKFLSAVLVILLHVLALGAGAQANTLVRLPEAEIALDQPSSLDVVLLCPASNCIGIDITVAYDADVLRIDEVVPADFLGDSPRVTSSETDSPGTFRFAALSSAGALRPEEGAVFSIRLTGLSLGESDLSVTSLTIFRRGGTLQATAEDGIVSVSEEAAGAGLAVLNVSRRLTVRLGPGAEFSAAATVEPGATLEVLGISSDGAWYLVALPGGAQGWLASSRFAVLSGNINQIPIIGDAVEATVEITAEPASPTPSSTPAPTATDAITPTASEGVKTLPTDSPTEPPTEAIIPSNTPVPIGPTVTDTQPTDAPTAAPTKTALPATATLRTDSQAQVAPPATETAEATATPTSTPTDTPQPTFTPSPTDTPAPPTPTFTATIPEPCTVTTTLTNVPVSVGPNRVVRTTFPVNQVVAVTGQQQADDGSLWWRLEPLADSLETDRFWVRQSDVTAQGGCDIVEDADAPQVISGGGSGTQFSGTFRRGQAFATHNFTISTSASYQIVCGGSPTYPEFSVGDNHSRGQTTIASNLTPGRYTLTVFASTVNSGQTVYMNSYTCSLSRR